MEPFIAITVSILFSVSLIFLITAYYKNVSEKTKHKISDADIFKLMARANHFLTDKQLAAVSELTKNEAKERLMYLSMMGVLRRFNDGGVNSVYQLKEELPEDKVLPMSIQGLSDRQIVDAVLKYSRDYQITIPELVVIFGITVMEAKEVLKRLRKSGLVGRLWKGMSIIHVVKDPLREVAPKLNIPTYTQKTPQITKAKEVGKMKIPDADVLNVAIENKGKITPTLLCLKLKIPMNEAKIKLEDLYDQGAFIMDVDTENAIIEYQLRDKNLLS